MARGTTDAKHYANIVDAICEIAGWVELQDGTFAPAEMPDAIRSAAGIVHENGINEGFKSGKQIGYESGYTDGVEAGKTPGKIELLQDSKYMNAKVSGDIVAVHDVSPVEHELGVVLRKKNLLNPVEITAASNATTLDGDILTTTFTNKAAYVNVEWVNGKPVRLPAGTYTFTLVPVSDTGMVCTFYVYNSSNTILFTQQMGASNGVYSFTFTAEEEFRPCLGGYNPYDAHSYKIQLEEGSVATPYAPYVANWNDVKVNRYGKNLFENNTDTISEITLVNANGNAKTYGGYAFALPAGTYTVHAEPKAGADLTEVYLYSAVNSADGVYVDGGVNFQVVVNGTIKTVTFTVAEPCVYYLYDSFSNVNLDRAKRWFEKFDVQIEVGAQATAYAPFVEPQTLTSMGNGHVLGVTSISPSMTLVPETEGVVIDCSYLRDIDTYIDNLLK